MQQLLRKERCFRQLRRALLSLTLVLGCGSLATGQTPLPEGKGKEMVEAVCTQCHGLRETTSARLTAQEWQSILNDMVARGAPLFDEENEVVAEYLAKNFGPEVSAKVNVNKATARELATKLGLSVKEAEAVVQYREKSGNLGNWEDLKKVPGLDIRTIEKEKDRLSF